MEPHPGKDQGQRGGNLPPSTGQEASGVRTTQGWDEELKEARGRMSSFSCSRRKARLRTGVRSDTGETGQHEAG